MVIHVFICSFIYSLICSFVTILNRFVFLIFTYRSSARPSAARPSVRPSIRSSARPPVRPSVRPSVHLPAPPSFPSSVPLPSPSPPSPCPPHPARRRLPASPRPPPPARLTPPAATCALQWVLHRDRVGADRPRRVQHRHPDQHDALQGRLRRGGGARPVARERRLVHLP